MPEFSLSAEPSSDSSAVPQVGSEADRWGTVLAVQANYYRVQLDCAATGAELSLLCTRRARLKKTGQQVMVGDRVRVVEPDWQGKRGAIAEVLPRSSELERPAIANVDQILLVFALAEPDLDANQLSRFLVTAEATGLRVQVCLNKCDLVSVSQRQTWQQRLKDWGYEPIFLSVQQRLGLELVNHRLQHCISVLAGPSGVGKSSLINALLPAAQLRVGEVSGKLAKGRHTTRHVELFRLPQTGLLADTPGFNRPELVCTPAKLASLFPEMRHRLESGQCQFADCLHLDEPNCVARGTWERYGHYREWLALVLAQQEQRQHQGTPDCQFKVKPRSGGGRQYEPRLEARKYRRPSRRHEQQSIQRLYQEIED